MRPSKNSGIQKYENLLWAAETGALAVRIGTFPEE